MAKGIDLPYIYWQQNFEVHDAFEFLIQYTCWGSTKSNTEYEI